MKTGKVKIVFKDFQFLGQDSIDAALFGRAVWEAYPDHYYEWSTAMYEAQDDEGDRGFGDLESIQKLTKTLSGIDADKVTKLMNDKKTQYQAAIEADRTEASSMGVNGTPSVIVGTKLFSALSPAAFTSGISAEIDAELKK